MKTKEYLASRQAVPRLQENHESGAPEEWLGDRCFGFAFFCGSIVMTLATSYMAAFLIIFISLPLIAAPRSPMLQSIGAGALLGIAALCLIGCIAKSRGF